MKTPDSIFAEAIKIQNLEITVDQLKKIIGDLPNAETHPFREITIPVFTDGKVAYLYFTKRSDYPGWFMRIR